MEFKKLKIYTNGARGLSCQINRIDQGFLKLGHELTEFVNEADLIYSNNFSKDWFQIIKDRADGKLKKDVKIIFCILDLPEHLIRTGQFTQENLEEIAECLVEADAVASISKFVHGQLEYYYGINSHIIYQPIQDIEGVSHVEIQKKYKYLHVGRRWDSNKNWYLIPDTLRILGEDESQFANIGSEMGPYGSNLSVLREDYLAKYYETADYCFCLGEIEGISLTIIEAMSKGCIPIIINSLTTKDEFLPSGIFPEYNICYKNPYNLANFIRYLENNNNSKLELKNKILNFYNKELKLKFNKTEVARKIIEVYNNIK